MPENQKHILIGDDEPQIRFSLSLLLREAGYGVVTAENGQQALDALVKFVEEARPLDLLITDLRMPGMDGLELIRKIRKMNLALPIMLLSAYGNEKVITELIRSGGSDFMGKPYDPDELLSRVDRLLSYQ